MRMLTHEPNLQIQKGEKKEPLGIRMIEMKSTNTREFLFIWKTKKKIHFPRIIGTCLQNNLEQERLTKQSGKMNLEVMK